MAENDYEKKDSKLNKIIIAGILSVIAVIVIVLILNYFSGIKEDLVNETEFRPESIAFRELKVRENEELGSYKLLDAKKGIYRIPIERAMKLLANEN